jgi:histidinol-phosphate aminotransferase
VDEPSFPNGLELLAKFPNLVVTRTFSKAYGLASLRVGYAAAAADITNVLNRVRQPFNVNSFALAAAAAALRDQEYLQQSVALNRAGMAQLTAGFAAMGLDYIPSVGNFVTVDVGQIAAPVYENLLREGVIVRPIANYGMPQHLRISIGKAEENQRFLEALKKVLGRS